MSETTWAPKVGDWCVWAGGYSDDIGEVVGVTARRVKVQTDWFGRMQERAVNIDKVVFVGAKDTATRLREQLKSSRAERDSAHNAASRAHTERRSKFIEAARGESAS